MVSTCFQHSDCRGGGLASDTHTSACPRCSILNSFVSYPLNKSFIMSSCIGIRDLWTLLHPITLSMYKSICHNSDSKYITMPLHPRPSTLSASLQTPVRGHANLTFISSLRPRYHSCTRLAQETASSLSSGTSAKTRHW